MNTKPTKYRCQELSEELALLQHKKVGLLADVEEAEKSGWSQNLTENLAKLKPLFDEAEALVLKVKALQAKLDEFTPEQLKMLEEFKKSYDSQKQNYIDKGILTAEGKYKCEIPGQHQGKEFTLPDWETIKKRFTKVKLKEMKTLNRGLFTIYPLGLKLKSVAEKALGEHDVTVSDSIKEENLHYFAESINPDGSSNNAKSFDELMTETSGFLLSTMDDATEINKTYPGTNLEKMIAHTADCRKGAKTKDEGKRPATYQQCLAAYIVSLEREIAPMYKNKWTCAGGSLLPNLHLVPYVFWNFIRINLYANNADVEHDGWRGGSSVIV